MILWFGIIKFAGFLCSFCYGEKKKLKLRTETAVGDDKWAADTQLREDEGQLGFGGSGSGRHGDWEPP